MNKLFIFMFLCFPVFSENCAAVDDLKNSMNAISSANMYAWGLVGVPAHLSEGEIAAREVYKLSEPLEIYEKFKKSNNEGKMYFLCILNTKDKIFYRKAVRDLKSNDELISAFSGDVLKKIPMREIIKRIELNGCDYLEWSVR